MAPTALANVISPLSIALSPNPSCSINGNRNGIAPTPTRNNDPAVTLTANVGIAISVRSSSGSRPDLRIPLACRTYRAHPSSPATISPPTPQAGNMPRPAVSNPNIRHASASADSTSPIPSSRPGDASRTSGTYSVTSTIPSTPMGTLMSKIQRQSQ